MQTLLWLPHKLQLWAHLYNAVWKWWDFVKYWSCLMSPFLLLLPISWWNSHCCTEHFLTHSVFSNMAPSEKPTTPCNQSSFAISTSRIGYPLSNIQPIPSRKQHLNIPVSTLQGPWALFPLSTYPWRRSSFAYFSSVTQWEQDLASEVDPAGWSKAWSSVAKCAFNTATLKAAIKVLLWWNWVPVHICNDNATPSHCQFRGCGHCWKCSTHLVDMSTTGRLLVSSVQPTAYAVPPEYPKGC